MNYRVFNLVSAVMAASFAIGSICIYECGSKDRIGLQSPSLLAPGSMDFYEKLMQEDNNISETGVVPISLGNPNVSINDYTFVAATSFSDVTVDYNNNPEDPVVYDGGTYWIKSNISLVPVKNDDAASTEFTEVKADAKQDTKTTDKEIKLKTGDTVVRISHNKDWSLVKLADGTQGYIKNTDLSETVITPVPTNTPTRKPTNTPKPKKKTTTTTKKTTKTSSSTTTKNGVKETKVSKTVYATTSLNTRSGPGISYSLLSTIKEGTKISVVAETDNGWYKSSSGYYVKSSYTTTKAPSSGSGSKATATPKPSGGGSSTKVGDKSGDFAKYVKSFIGCKYVAGGSSPTKGFDCSGFVMYCYKNYYNISLPHGATSQSKKGKEVAKEDIQCGDIICFDRNGDGTMEHSALYIGNDTYVHAKGAKYGVVADKFSSAKNIAHIRRVR
ncbi:MAG: C40 family peptidase [Saccharofermentans sp.]|nr:C40 family peptidase [Saccharofermentans sp.]